jgi:hypothetical protein
VLIVKVPLFGAVQDHHSELITPLWRGSPTSAVAPIFDPCVLGAKPLSKILSAKLLAIVFLPFFLVVTLLSSYQATPNFFCIL